MMIYNSVSKFLVKNAKVFGIFIAFSGIIFVVDKIVVYGSQINFGNFGKIQLVFLIFISIVSGVSNILLAAGWRKILDYVGVQRSFRWAAWIYATSQLAKYVPGNVFQFVGRQAWV